MSLRTGGTETTTALAEEQKGPTGDLKEVEAVQEVGTQEGEGVKT